MITKEEIKEVTAHLKAKKINPVGVYAEDRVFLARDVDVLEEKDNKIQTWRKNPQKTKTRTEKFVKKIAEKYNCSTKDELLEHFEKPGEMFKCDITKNYFKTIEKGAPVLIKYDNRAKKLLNWNIDCTSAFDSISENKVTATIMKIEGAYDGHKHRAFYTCMVATADASFSEEYMTSADLYKLGKLNCLIDIENKQ